MKYTDNYGLKKPELNDYVNIEDFNENADIIDKKLKNVTNDQQATKTEFDAHQAENATENQLGHVKSGASIIVDSNGKMSVQDGIINGKTTDMTYLQIMGVL